MICPKCSSTNVHIETVQKKRSFLWNLLMIFLTGGFWLLWMLIRGRKTRKVCICQDCGKSWNL